MARLTKHQKIAAWLAVTGIATGIGAVLVWPLLKRRINASVSATSKVKEKGPGYIVFAEPQ